MNCLKCGSETVENKVFCEHCQTVMQAYPIKAGTVIHLPHREPPASEKKAPAKRRDVPVSDALPQLRKLIRFLTATIALLSLLLCISAGMLIHILMDTEAAPAIGRNYTTSQSKNNP